MMMFGGKTTQERRKDAVYRVDPAFGFVSVAVSLSVPALPDAAANATFAEHPFDAKTGSSTDTVVLAGVGGFAISRDLGVTWRWVDTPEIGKARLRNSFTLANGDRLLQESAPADVAGWPGPRLLLTDADGRVSQVAQVGESPWHGPRAIGESGGTLMFAEYPGNAAKYRKDFQDRRVELEPQCRDCRVYRSRDAGRTWQAVFRVPWSEIRHFHTLLSDPHERGVWWLSSGDTPAECRIWRSADDGEHWLEVTDPSPQIDLHPKAGAYRMSAHRYTDAIILPDRLFWGTDDVLGPKKLLADESYVEHPVGSRLVSATKTVPLRLTSHAYIGNQVRSIVDLGPVYLILTEAKVPAVFPGPQILMMSKENPDLVAPLFMADFAGLSADTGFTYSVASRVAKEGTFFSLRKSSDVFESGPQLLKWHLEFR